jgi:hypothetical protein
MFAGTVPPLVTRIADEHVRAWEARTVFIGCSGAFTVENHLCQYGLTLHSNDVTLFSAILGGYFAGKPYPLKLTEAGAEELPWIEEHLQEPASALAAAMILGQYSMALGRQEKDNPYYARLRDAYQQEWPSLHQRVVEGIRASDLHLASYTSEDVMTWLERVPPDAAVIAYPPFPSGGAASWYAKDFAGLERVFEWEAPPFTMIQDDAATALYEKIADRHEWLFAVNKPVPSLAGNLRAITQTTNRAPMFHVYAADGPRRRVGPRQAVESTGLPYIGPGDVLGSDIQLHLLSSAQFQQLRSVYMNPGIRPGSANLPVAVTVDGLLVGCFAYSFAPTFANWDRYLAGPSAYMLSDFPVASSRYDRLAKLIIMAACSVEATELIRRYGRSPFRSMTTTALSKGPVSMKYRGALTLLKREENHSLDKEWAFKINPDDPYFSRPYQLQYGSELPRWTLAEALEIWKRKHGKAMKK